MNVDRDLRDALAPLAGDPIADAARVLAALPPTGPTGSPRRKPDGSGPSLPPWAWWMTGGSALAGLLGGLAIGLANGSGPTTPTPAVTAPAVQKPEKPPEPPPKEQPKQDPNPDPDKPQPDPPWGVSGSDPDYLMLMSFGEMKIDEPGEGVQVLQPDAYHVRIDTVFTTGDGRAGIHVLANDGRVRLDLNTEVRIGTEEFELRRGRLYVCCARGDRTFRLTTPLATAQFDMGSDVMAYGDERGVTLLGVRGRAIVRTRTGETLRLVANEAIKIDPQTGASPPARVPFLGTETSWMTPMIILQQDPAELRGRVLDMIAAYEAGEQRAAAEVEIRRLGARCVPMLAYGAEKRLDDPAYAQDVAILVADLVDYDYAQYLFGLLKSGDSQVRQTIFRGIRRATGTAEADDKFWRDAALDERQAAIARWQQRLQR